VLIGTLADEHTIFFEIQHFYPRDPEVLRRARSNEAA
jgi:hypothetical protein